MDLRNNMVNYEKTYNEFDLAVPEFFNFSRDVIDKWAEDQDKLAIWWVNDEGDERKESFAELSKKSRQLCNLLSEQGVKRGNVVIVVLPRLIEWWEINIACLRMGAIISPGTLQLTAKDLSYRINTAEAVCVVTDNDNAAKFDAIRGECPTLKSLIVIGEERKDWINYSEVAQASDHFITANTRSNDNAILYFTSGTTGYPKMAIHTHASAPIGHIVTGKFWLDLMPDDLHWNLAETGWAKAGWSSLFGPWNCGAALFVHHTARFDVKKTLNLLQKYPITTMCGPPTAFRMLVLEDLPNYKFKTLRHSGSSWRTA